MNVNEFVRRVLEKKFNPFNEKFWEEVDYFLQNLSMFGEKAKSVKKVVGHEIYRKVLDSIDRYFYEEAKKFQEKFGRKPFNKEELFQMR